MIFQLVVFTIGVIMSVIVYVQIFCSDDVLTFFKVVSTVLTTAIVWLYIITVGCFVSLNLWIPK